MKTNPRKLMFAHMRALGFYKNYENYDEFNRKKYGVGTTEETETWKEDNFTEPRDQELWEALGGR